MCRLFFQEKQNFSGYYRSVRNIYDNYNEWNYSLAGSRMLTVPHSLGHGEVESINSIIILSFFPQSLIARI